MLSVLTETKNGSVREFAYTLEEIKKSGIDKNSFFATFDIETSTLKDLGPPQAFMYHFQFCIDRKVMFGRYWHEFQELLNWLVEYLQLNSKKKN